MSQPKTGAQPAPAAPAAHGDKKASEASSTLGEKKAEVAEKSPASAKVSQPTKTQTSGTPSAAKISEVHSVRLKTPVLQQPPSADASEPQLKKPSDTKPTPTSKPEPGKNALSTKPNDSQNKQPSEERQKEPSGAQSPTSPSMKTTSKPNSPGKATAAPTDQPPQAASVERAKAKSQKMSTVADEGTASTSVVATPEGSSAESGMDESALDSLIDTLGGPEEDVPTNPVYTGPEVKEDISSRFLEELGKREGSLPPEYVKLLKSKGVGRDRVPPKADGQDEKKMTEDELAEALSSGFTCSTAPAEGKTSLTETPSKEGEIVQAQAASTIKASVPPKEVVKSKEEITDDAVEALLDTLGGPEPEPEEDLTPVVEVSEAKAKEKKEEKTGERDDTIPPEYRFTPKLDKDGKPVLPKPEEKPKPSAPVTAKPTQDEVVPRAAACTVQSSAPSAAVGGVADEALEALSSSLGKRERDPEEKKPTVDTVKEKSKEEKRQKLGEDEETIPPDYRLRETKDNNGKVLLPKPEEESQPMSENDLIEGLTEGFSSLSGTPFPTSKMRKKYKKSKKVIRFLDSPAGTLSSVHSASPSSSTSGEKGMGKALDLLSDSLGQREPDPDKNKPVDKIKKKAKYEHRDRLGVRDYTIPPEHVKRLVLGEQDKSGKETITTKPAQEDKGKPKDPETAMGQSSSSKPEKQKTS